MTERADIADFAKDEGGPKPRLAVVAIGGGAFLPAGDVGTPHDQERAARRVARAIALVVREGFRVLVVHGNGPQVGRELTRSEAAAQVLPPRPLAASVAATQGTMGARLVLALRNVLKAEGLARPVTAVLTEVLVNPNDPALAAPSRPVGPVYTEWRARELKKLGESPLAEEPGVGWRRVVASPKPLDVLDLQGIEALLAADHVVVAGGGGGVAVAVDPRGDLVAVDGVVEKDRTAALLGALLGADLLVWLTGSDQLHADFGRPEQRPLGAITVAEARRLLDGGHLPTGGMAVKVEAALDFLAEGGEAVLVTSERKLAAALADRAGTRIAHRVVENPVRKQLGLFDVEPADPRSREEGGGA